MPSRAKFRERREQRREDAARRQEARDKRGDAGQLQKLEHHGHGEGREAKRLRNRLGQG